MMELNKNSWLWKFAKIGMSSSDSSYYESGYGRLDTCTLAGMLLTSLLKVVSLTFFASLVIVIFLFAIAIFASAAYALDSGMNLNHVLENIYHTWWYVIPYGIMIAISYSILLYSTVWLMKKIFKPIVNNNKRHNSLDVVKEVVTSKIEKTCVRIVLK